MDEFVNSEPNSFGFEVHIRRRLGEAHDSLVRHLQERHTKID